MRGKSWEDVAQCRGVLRIEDAGDGMVKVHIRCDIIAEHELDDAMKGHGLSFRNHGRGSNLNSEVWLYVPAKEE